jgi:hypothetical protein
MKKNNTMIEYNKESTYFYLKENKNAPKPHWSLGSQYFTSFIIRVHLGLSDKNIGMVYWTYHSPKYYYKGNFNRYIIFLEIPMRLHI